MTAAMSTSTSDPNQPATVPEMAVGLLIKAKAVPPHDSTGVDCEHALPGEAPSLTPVHRQAASRARGHADAAHGWPRRCPRRPRPQPAGPCRPRGGSERFPAPCCPRGPRRPGCLGRRGDRLGCGLRGSRWLRWRRRSRSSPATSSGAGRRGRTAHGRRPRRHTTPSTASTKRRGARPSSRSRAHVFSLDASAIGRPASRRAQHRGRLRRRTSAAYRVRPRLSLPWERTAGSGAPWLALLVLDDDEGVHADDAQVGDLRRTPFAADPQRPTIMKTSALPGATLSYADADADRALTWRPGHGLRGPLSCARPARGAVHRARAGTQGPGVARSRASTIRRSSPTSWPTGRRPKRPARPRTWSRSRVSRRSSPAPRVTRWTARPTCGW